MLGKRLLFALTTLHVLVLAILRIHSIVTLMKVKRGEVPAQQGCSTLNGLVSVTIVIHGCATYLLALHGYWTLFVLDVLILRWTINKIIGGTNEGIYDVKTILNTGQIAKHITYNYACLVYFAVCLYIYKQALFEGSTNTSDTDWGVFDLINRFFFICSMCLLEVLLIILAYSFAALSNIEVDNTCAQDVCQYLYGLLVVKTMVHALLIFTLLLHTSWAFFISNLQILRFEIRKIAGGGGSNLGIYNPEDVQFAFEIRKHWAYYITCFLYFAACFNMYMYYTLVSNTGVMLSVLFVFLPMVLLEMYEISNVEGGFPGVIRFLYLLTQGQLGYRLAGWSTFLTYFFEWSVAILYCFYLLIWKQDWTVEEDGDYMLYMLIDIIYDFF